MPWSSVSRITGLNRRVCKFSDMDSSKSAASSYKNKADTRTKDWVYIWYRKQVMVRNKQYSLLANQDGTNAALTRYKGPFKGKQLADNKLSKTERALKEQFEAKIAELAKTRLTTASKDGRIQGLKNKTNR